MIYSNNEIYVDFRNAKNKKEQIKILADLNACKPADISEILVNIPDVQYTSDELSAINKYKFAAKAPKIGKWSADEIEQLRRMYGQGRTAEDVAIALGRTKQSVFDKAKTLGITKAKKPKPKANHTQKQKEPVKSNETSPYPCLRDMGDLFAVLDEPVVAYEKDYKTGRIIYHFEAFGNKMKLEISLEISEE